MEPLNTTIRFDGARAEVGRLAVPDCGQMAIAEVSGLKPEQVTFNGSIGAWRDMELVLGDDLVCRRDRIHCLLVASIHGNITGRSRQFLYFAESSSVRRVLR